MIPFSFFQKFNYYLPETLAYKAGVEADGGTLIDIDYLDTKIRAFQAEGSWSNLLVWVDANLGIKKDGSDRVSKLYNVMDFTQAFSQADAGAWPLWTNNGRTGTKDSLTYDGGDFLTFNVNTILAGLNVFTIESWINPSAINTNNSPWFSDLGNECFPTGRFTSGAKLQFYSFKTAGTLSPVNNLQSTTTFSTSTYYHIALRRDATNNKFFLIGVEESTQAGVLTEAATANCQLGGFTGSASHFFGNIDNFRIWNVARTGAKLIEHAD